ncbi:WD40 repeat domain-containing protein [Nonomuraea candida]|uniref:WD40 repeat domain-containing protein n=1 Tax=Nonomuraea candida TaxID=359159 RepID=UPI000A4EF5A7|nr:WD40 repeat domain-containing protein [Nonomuraea candida]
MAADRGVPAVVRSRQELIERGVAFPAPARAATALPITSNGTTYEMAQQLTWLDQEHFVVGRWDGSMSVFRFTDSSVTGPVISEAVTSPAFQGVRMLAALPGRAFASSNDDRSIALWAAGPGGWPDLRAAGTHGYDPALGVATGAIGTGQSLVVGHTTGHVSIWKYAQQERRLRFLRAVDVRNPSPVNPWGLHDIHAIRVVSESSGRSCVVAGSEDGYLSVVEVPSGAILSQTVFNPQAQRGINSLSVSGDKLLVANCSVGPQDHNLWYYSIDPGTWQITLLDQANLIVDTQRPQAFNFATTWGAYSGGPCWFASTEEGALWMGTAGAGLSTLGYQAVTSPLGSTLGYASGPGRLVMVAYDLYEYTTGA